MTGRRRVGIGRDGRRTPLAVVAVAVAVMGLLVWHARSAPGAGEGIAAPRATTSPSPPPGAIDASSPGSFPAFAEAVGVVLHLPAADPVAVLYHEASYAPAQRLHPYGHCVRNENRTKFSRPTSAPPGPTYTVMASRGRAHPATSAADVVILRGDQAFAPVTGTVVGLRRYELYGRYPDIRLAIAPDGFPGVKVVLIHLTHVTVTKGQTVVASVTALGTPRVFPFRSQVDDYVPGGNPHVHMEVKRATRGAP